MALSNFFWDTNVTALPDDTLIPDGPQAWRYLIANVPALFGSEHHTFPTGTNIGAWHRPGSANIFVEATAPTARVDSQPFDSNDVGRLWYDTTLGIFKILTAIGADVWTPLPSLTAANNYTGDFVINTDKFTVAAATGNTAVAGTLGVTGPTELIGIATVADASVTKTTAAPTANAQLTNKKYVDDQDKVLVNGSPVIVATKYLTGTLDNDTTTSVTHGIADFDDILHVSAACMGDSGSYRVGDFNLGSSTPTDENFRLSYTSTSIAFNNVGNEIQGNVYRIKIDYLP